MRSKELKKALLQGQTVFGTMVREFRFPAVAQILANAGFDFLLIDLEHGALSTETVADLIRQARFSALAPIVRMPAYETLLFSRCMDSGAEGVMVSQVAGYEDANRAVELMYYPPKGRRGTASPVAVAHTDYREGDLTSMMADKNESNILAIQIETAGALQDVEKIAQLDGGDVLMFTPMDLSVALGVPLEVEGELMSQVLDRFLAAAATMRIALDLTPDDLKQPIPRGLSRAEEKRWRYQRYIKDYLRCVASIDDNVGRLLDELESQGLSEDTIVVYTSDQGFFLGDHGWYDKRFMYEESLRMPLIIRYPREIKPGSVNQDMILNVDFARTFLDYANVEPPEEMQGRSFRQVLRSGAPDDWQKSMYYRYWTHLSHHHVYAHYGVRTLRHKLIYYYAQACGQPGAINDPHPPEWELFDLEEDPFEMHNVYTEAGYADVVRTLKDELHHLQAQVGDEPVFPEVD